jgi:hypothetical protein
MVHGSIIGSVERAVAHLIEPGGAFPAWLAPTQLVLLPVSDTELTPGRRFEPLAATEIVARIGALIDAHSNELWGVPDTGGRSRLLVANSPRPERTEPMWPASPAYGRF